MADNRNKIDFIFIPIPLWVTYSGLPEKIGITAWSVFRRLLELRYRFNSTVFYYPLDSLRWTCGLKSTRGLRKILASLANDEGLIRYTSGLGRGNATEFEIIEPLRTPMSEEEVYLKHPRLSSLSFRDKYAPGNPEKGNHVPVLGTKKEEQYSPLKNKKGEPRSGFTNEKGNYVPVLGGKKGNVVPPNKKDCKKDNNNKSDLHPEEGKNKPVVVLFDRLKKYRLSRKLIEEYLKNHSPAYLEEKIEIVEFMRSKKKKLKNPGGMLRKAIEEDWQPPEGFTTAAERRAQAEEKRARIRSAAAREREEERQAAERERIEKAVKEWRAAAPADLLEEIKARAVHELEQELPNLDKKMARIPIKIRMNEIIAREYLDKHDMEKEQKERS